LALSKSGIDRISTTKIVKLNTEIIIFIKKLQIYLKILVSIRLTILLFSRHKREFIIYTNKNTLVGKYRGLKLPGSGGGVGCGRL
jgi:hypothetical protein